MRLPFRILVCTAVSAVLIGACTARETGEFVDPPGVEEQVSFVGSDLIAVDPMLGTELWRIDEIDHQPISLIKGPGRLYVITADIEKAATLRAVSPDGVQQWSAALTDGSARYAYETPTRVGGDLVVTGPVDSSDPVGEVRRIDGTTGDILWRAEIAQPATRPMVSGDQVLVATREQSIVVIDAEDGSVTATHPLPMRMTGSAATCGPRVCFGVSDLGGAAVIAFDADTGGWAATPVDGWVAAIRSVDASHVLVDARKLNLVDVDASEVVWSRTSGGRPRLIEVDQIVVAEAPDETIRAVTLDSGKRIWRTEPGEYISRMRTTDDWVVALRQHGATSTLVAHRIDGDGSVAWAVDPPGWGLTDLVMGDGIVFVGTKGGLDFDSSYGQAWVTAYDVTTGAVVWQLDTVRDPNEIVLHDGLLYVLTSPAPE